MKKAVRTGSIEIDLIAPGGTQWVVASIQALELNDLDEVTAILGKSSKIYRRVDKAALDMVEFTDPVTGVTTEISLVGIGTAIKAMMIKWMLEDMPNSSFDTDADRVFIDESN
jgi:hypothetical protein